MTSKPNYFSEAPPPNTITLWVRASIDEFGRAQTFIQSIAVSFKACKAIIMPIITTFIHRTLALSQTLF